MLRDLLGRKQLWFAHLGWAAISSFLDEFLHLQCDAFAGPGLRIKKLSEDTGRLRKM